MRRSPSRIALIFASLVFAAHCSQAVAQIEFAKSTIRFTPTSGPAPNSAPTVVPTEEPQAFEPQAQEQVDNSPERSLLVEAPIAKPAPAAAPVPHYPIRQADFAQPSAPRSLVHAPVQARAPSTVNVYASANAQATLNKMPRPAPIQPRATGGAAAAAAPSRLRGKPFRAVDSQPTISPYLNMARGDNNSNTMLTYFTQVRPQLQQQEASRQQSAEIQKLRGQLQNLSAGAGASTAPNSASMTAHAHYMDTAQFHRGMHR